MKRVIFLLSLMLLVLSACAPQRRVPSDINFERGYSSMSDNWPADVARWKSQIETAAKKFDLPADLVAGMVMTDSAGDADAISAFGAVGLMQIVASDLDTTGYFKNNPTSAELSDPITNLEIGCGILASLIHKDDQSIGLTVIHPVDELEWAVFNYGDKFTGDEFYYLTRVYEFYVRYK